MLKRLFEQEETGGLESAKELKFGGKRWKFTEIEGGDTLTKLASMLVEAHKQYQEIISKLEKLKNRYKSVQKYIALSEELTTKGKEVLDIMYNLSYQAILDKGEEVNQVLEESSKKFDAIAVQVKNEADFVVSVEAKISKASGLSGGQVKELVNYLKDYLQLTEEQIEAINDFIDRLTARDNKIAGEVEIYKGSLERLFKHGEELELILKKQLPGRKLSAQTQEELELCGLELRDYVVEGLFDRGRPKVINNILKVLGNIASGIVKKVEPIVEGIISAIKYAYNSLSTIYNDLVKTNKDADKVLNILEEISADEAKKKILAILG